MALNSELFLKLGDTSYRRKDVVDAYRGLLKVLEDFKGFDWNDRQTQRAFIERAKFDGLVADSGKNAEIERWARTSTYGLVVVGLCDEDRKLTPAGEKLLSTFERNTVDNSESFAGLAEPAAVFFRQLLLLSKRTVAGELVYPFRLLTRIITQRGPLTRHEFNNVIGGILNVTSWGPIDDYLESVSDETLEGAFEKATAGGRSLSQAENEFLRTGEPTIEVFKNRKSSKYVGPVIEFVNAVLSFNEAPSGPRFDTLLRTLQNPAVKAPFNLAQNFPRKYRDGSKWQEFARLRDNPFVDPDAGALRRKLLTTFKRSKSAQTRSEYADLNLRLFKASGVISTSTSDIGIPDGPKFELLRALGRSIPYRGDYAASHLSGSESFEQLFGKDPRTQAERELERRYGVHGAQLEERLFQMRLEESKTFVISRFPRTEVVELLKLAQEDTESSRNQLRNRVTDEATIPTIFEYVVGLAWAYITEFQFALGDALGLSLDANLLPQTHAGGHRGDIEIDMGDFAILVEATLMDVGNQRRNELEPVLRHAVNFERRMNLPVYSFFVANVIDHNVSQIFRFASLMNLKPTQNYKGIASPRITSMTSRELAYLLEANVVWGSIESVFDAEFENSSLSHMNGNWRERLISSMA